MHTPGAATEGSVTLSNESPIRTDSLYFAIDYVTLRKLPANLGRFHAQYRQAAPCVATFRSAINGEEPEWRGQLRLS